MTLPSKDQQVVDYVKQQLEQVPVSTAEQQALANARAKALKQLNTPQKAWWLQPMPQLAMAASLALVVSITVFLPKQSTTIAYLPEQLMQSDMPSEDLAMLQQLEFATWLAENEQQLSL